MRRTLQYQIIDQTLSSATHGIGAILGIIGLIFLIIRGLHEASPLRTITFTIYGSILVMFYITSSLFHGLYFTKVKKVFQVFDHSSIYLLIGGTYTPYCLVSIRGRLGLTILSVIWLMAILGIVYKSIWLGRFNNLSTVIYVVMGWMCVIGAHSLWDNLGGGGFWLLFSGGVVFTVGAVIYSFKQIPYGHVIWHLFVMAGTALMYFSIYWYV